ncbi:MAG: Crp/Fnr family transcriptional regulator [Sphingomonadales bacterium]|nr:Crp/Fnr family transcriptional regulator [Sphingomonadales bacterium]
MQQIRHSPARDPRRVMAVPAGAVLYRPDDECPGFVVVHSGSVKVSLTAENGREIMLYRVRPGDVCLQTFGCLVSGSAYSAEAVAETPVEIEIIPVAEFQRLVAEDAPFRQQLFAAVANRFADLERLVEDVALSSLEARLARALLRLVDAEGMVNATHESLAVEIGSARAVVSRQIGQFARDGLVEATRGHIRVLAPGRLEAVSHEAD